MEKELETKVDNDLTSEINYLAMVVNIDPDSVNDECELIKAITLKVQENIAVIETFHTN